MKRTVLFILICLAVAACQSTPEQTSESASTSAAEAPPSGRRATVRFYLVRDPLFASTPPTTVKGTSTRVHLASEPFLDESAIRRASVAGQDPAGGHRVLVVFTDQGANTLAEVTGANVGGQIGIVIDGELIVAPTIHAPMTTNAAYIAGGYTQEEAAVLAKRINAGAG